MHPKISILHATFRSQSGPVSIKETWLQRAERPELIEYVFAMDADDEATVSETEGHHRVVGSPGDGQVTAVRNWNAAAAATSSGDILMVIADDLLPPQAWDTTLVTMIGSLDASTVAFAIKVTDSPYENDTLLRHPIVSRAFYQRYGLFSSGYRGVFCDNDITVRAFWHSVILDGRSMILEHQHPAFNTSEVWSESQRSINTPFDYQRGRELFEATWSLRQRLARRHLAPTGPQTQLSESALLAFQRKSRFIESVLYPYRRARWTLSKLLRPENTLNGAYVAPENLS
jgi:hypothetical protein